jgi:hypothetical protein
MSWITGPDPIGADAGQSGPDPADQPEASGPPPSYPSYPPTPQARPENRRPGAIGGKSGAAAAWARFRAFKRWQQGLIVLGLLAVLGAVLPDQSPKEAATAPTTVPTDGPKSSNEPSAPTAAPVTDDEVVAAFQSFVDERVAAGVRFAGTVRNITISNRVVRVVFDPAKAGFDLATFRSINPFDNLAEFAGTPIMFKDDVGNRLRPAIDAVETVLPDGTSLGSLTTAKLYKIGTGEDLSASIHRSLRFIGSR